MDIMDIEVLIPLLAEARPCSGLTEAELRRIAAVGEVREIEAGADLIVEGDSSHEMFVVLEGTAGAFKADPNGRREIALTEVCAGESIGELSMLRTERRLATVRATTNCTVFVLDRPAFDKLTADGDAAAYKMALQLAHVVSDRMMLMHDKLMGYLRDGGTRSHEFTSFKREMMRDWDF